MAQITNRGSDEVIKLIENYTEPHLTRPGLGKWRVWEHGVPMWALIGALILDDAVPVEQSLRDDAQLPPC